MANNRKRDLLFFIENEVQFESLRPLLVYIKKNKLASFDILIPSGGSSEAVNLKDIYEGGAKIAKDNNFCSWTSEKYKIPGSFSCLYV